MFRAFCFYALASFILLACSSTTGGGGSTISNSSKITSSVLAPASSSLKIATTAIDCALATDTSLACTPSNLTGRIFAMGALLGREADGNSNYNMTFMADNEEIITDPSLTTHPEGTNTFDLLSPVTFSGLISIPAEEDMPSTPEIWRVESYFDMIDATFTISGTGNSDLDKEHTIRTVFRSTISADDLPSGTTAQVGDKLYKDSDGTFKWCDATSCGQTERPSSPLQSSNVTAAYNAIQTSDQPGNRNYALYSIDFEEDDYLTVSHSTISDTTKLWTLNFNTTTAINFTSSSALSSISSVAELVTAFYLGLGCSYSGCDQDTGRIKSSLTIE